jgi:diguanylate cyclase
VSESPDWKEKYRESVLELESQEKRGRQIEQTLRRLVGRLCAAGMGVAPQLDDELTELAAANRRNAAATELERLADSLTTTVVAVDALAPVPKSVPSPGLPRWEATRNALGNLLQRFRLVGDPDAVATLIAKVPMAASDADIAGLLEQTAEMIRAHGEALAQERTHAAALLAQATNRLDEVAGYLTESGDDTRSRFADTASVTEAVITEVRELTAEVNCATDLRGLQAAVATRLETVTQRVMEFRARDESRLREYVARTERLRTRIADLESERVDLHVKLDREKHGARQDGLTRLANRKGFDERFAEEALRCCQADRPVNMLLWDLDDFKRINDTYGHPAGDRVLQSVAACFLSAVRGEDFVARIGGEEFVVLMAGMRIARALHIADELRTAVHSLRFHFRGAPVRITASCGLTDLRPDDAAGAAFDRADAALYQAKREGKNRCFASSS